jgi:hypothetical protein
MLGKFAGTLASWSHWHSEALLLTAVAKGNLMQNVGRKLHAHLGAGIQRSCRVFRSNAFRLSGTAALIGAALSVSTPPALADFIQQGSKLVGTGAVGSPAQGISVAVSSDGNTAIVGGNLDNGNAGAAWVFTRSGGVWTQQGGKLVGTGAVGNAQQGRSVALSADGNTAIVGGFADSSSAGAVWVYTRSGGVWTQQGLKLVGTGATGAANQGRSVSLSADGNTAIVGGNLDNSNAGAAWFYTRIGGVWTQQGSKLVGTGAVGNAQQGISVALSADGNTAIVGGPGDNTANGAAWVYTRSGGFWTQQGGKLFGTGTVGNAQQGDSVALSADGNTAIVGGDTDGGVDVGAAWVFTRSGGVWTQQGNKLVGSVAVGASRQGISTALSADGRTAILGGSFDNSQAGAAWVFLQLANATHDFDGNGKSDIAWRQSNSNVAIWLMNGAAVTSAGSLGAVPSNWQIVGQRDFNGDRKHDLLWRDTSTGATAIWFLNGTSVSSTAGIGTVPTNWQVVGTGDADGDGKGDILWRDSTTGAVAIWLMNGAAISSAASFGNVPAAWSVVGLADFTGNGKADILWRNTSTGDVAMWGLDGTSVTGTAVVGNVPTVWTIVATGDFNGDGKADIAWRDTAGNLAIWLMEGAKILQAAGLGNVPTDWIVTETGDFNGDGKSDLLWRNTTTGDAAIWFMNGVALSSAASLGVIGTDWVIQGVNAN